MRFPSNQPLVYWSIRAVIRRRSEHLVLILALVATIAWSSAQILNVIRIRSAITQAIDLTPAITIRVESTAQDRMNSPDMIKRIRSIPGVISVKSSELSPDIAFHLKVEVFESQEIPAIASELMSWNESGIRIETREDISRALRLTLNHLSTNQLLGLIPSILALSLLVLATFRMTARERGTMGLLRSLGWSTFDILKMELTRAMLVLIPSIAMGFGVTGWLVCGPVAPFLYPDIMAIQPVAGIQDLPLTFLFLTTGIGALIGIPFLTAAILPVLIHAHADPGDWIMGARQ